MADTVAPSPGTLPPAAASASRPPLPVTAVGSAPAAPFGLEALGCLLGVLASRPGPVPKYRYPSAGTLNPVQTYLVLRDPLSGLAAGTYYHDPDEHALVPVSAATPAAPDGSSSPTLLVLVAQRSAIMPIYGEHAADFSLLEAGYMHQALCDAGSGLRLRDTGDPAGSDALRAACVLEDSHVPLACWAVGEDA